MFRLKSTSRYLKSHPSQQHFAHTTSRQFHIMPFQNIKSSTKVENHIEKHLVPDTPAFTYAQTNSTNHGIPMIAVSPSQGKFVSLLTTANGSKNILELGTLGGYSTIWFAQALKNGGKGGKVTSIEIDPGRRDISIQNLEYAGVKVPEETEILLGAGLDVLPKLGKEIESGQREPFDFVFIDADWNNQWNYFDWGVKLSRGKGSVVYVDNVIRQLIDSGIVGPKLIEEGLDDLVENAGKDDRVDAVAIQTVGTKGYDGFLMALVK